MRIHKILILSVIFSITAAFTGHKFFVSVTKIEYKQEKESLQIITQIFVDDLEKTLSERHLKEIHIGTKKETAQDEEYLKEYLLKKLKIKVNGAFASLNYIGKEMDIDQVKCYFEVTGISELKGMEIENKILMDLFEDQQNIIHVKTPSNRRSLILDRANPKGMLNF